MPKLTETTNDKMRKGKSRVKESAVSINGGAAQPPFHITEMHEPLRNEAFIPPHILEALQRSPIAQTTLATPPAMAPAPAAELAPLKVALVGTAPSSRLLAPFNDPSWKIWACSPGNMNLLPRIDAWFEIHGNLLWPEHESYGKPYIEWLKKQTFPIYMQDNSLVPNAITFPKDEMVRQFGRDFFTSSFSWMLAFAMHSGAKEISLYGIDMASREEYILQRPGFYFFRHIARTRGVKVSAPHESDIMMSPGLYGFSDVLPFGRKLHARRMEIKNRINQMMGVDLPRAEAEVARIKENITYLRGADEDIDYMTAIWVGVQDNSQRED